MPRAATPGEGSANSTELSTEAPPDQLVSPSLAKMGRMKWRDERGLSNSVQVAVLFPLGLGVFLALLQWALIVWAESSAIAAAQQGASVAAQLGSTEAEGRQAALEAADNGSLHEVSATIERGPRVTSATVTGRAVVVLWPREVSKTVILTTERVSGP